MTYLYLDTEFASFGGELISMALVPHDGGAPFYEVRAIPKDVHPWVAENVLPKVEAQPCGDEYFRKSLWHFMRQHDGATIVADWPEDLGHFAMQMCTIGGIAPNIKWTLKLIESGPLESVNPHNALADAQALAIWCRANMNQWS